MNIHIPIHYKYISRLIAIIVVLIMELNMLKADVPCYGIFYHSNPSNPGPIGDQDSFQGACYREGTNCFLYSGTSCDRWHYDPETTDTWICYMDYEETGMFCHVLTIFRTRIGNNGTPWTSYNSQTNTCDIGCRDRYDYQIGNYELQDGEMRDHTDNGQDCSPLP